ncbi:hypothetical protein FVE67_06580 [Thermosulfurimonas marina]|uniref:Uncharacterized protein n=1 Tax=Thermosulfurimonas marina TaxID=2047767 RepID=A0A6H1WTK8_9BACT|nr:hypothetical protein [Thermosulfurimonas marina]QJA06484.1 hypothetical protein FVE67_06580 [Thermosulfurimonas marina]
MDPRSVCRAMVSTVSETETLPEEVPEGLKLLFEEWLDELLAEAQKVLQKEPHLSDRELARRLRVPLEGATYLRHRLLLRQS